MLTCCCDLSEISSDISLRNVEEQSQTVITGTAPPPRLHPYIKFRSYAFRMNVTIGINVDMVRRPLKGVNVKALYLGVWAVLSLMSSK